MQIAVHSPDEAAQGDGDWMRPLAVSIASGASAAPVTVAPVTVAMVASLPDEGTTSAAVALAHALEGGLGRRVAILDANFATPGLHRAYGLPQRPGLADVLRGSVPLRRALNISADERLGVLPAGDIPLGTASVLLAAERGLSGVLRQLQAEGFGVCILDCPPVLTSPEAAIVAKQADLAYLVVAAERTTWDTMRQGLAALAAAPVQGVVLNRYRAHVPSLIARML